MIIGLLGLTGSGKSTCATILSQKISAVVFDMDLELPEEYRRRTSGGEIVPADDVKIYQNELIPKLVSLSNIGVVVLAGFFLDKELPTLLSDRTEVVWINLVTDNKDLLIRRVLKRKNHFVQRADIIEDNWPNKEQFIVGDNIINCEQEISAIIADCLGIISKYNI